jgi:hypothetical protein
MQPMGYRRLEPATLFNQSVAGFFMSSVGCILCIVNVTRCAERTLRVCYRWGGFFMYRSVDVMGVVGFLCTVRLMFLVWWIFNVPFG